MLPGSRTRLTLLQLVHELELQVERSGLKSSLSPSDMSPWTTHISGGRDSITALRQLVYGVFIGVSLSFTSVAIAQWFKTRKPQYDESKLSLRPIEIRTDEIVNGVAGLVGKFNLLYFVTDAS